MSYVQMLDNGTLGWQYTCKDCDAVVLAMTIAVHTAWHEGLTEATS